MSVDLSLGELHSGDIVKLTPEAIEWFKGKKWATADARAKILYFPSETAIRVRPLTPDGMRFGGTYSINFWEPAPPEPTK